MSSVIDKNITGYIETKLYLYELWGNTDSALRLLYERDLEEFAADNLKQPA